MKKIIFPFLLIMAVFQCRAIDGILIKTLDYALREKWNKTVSSSVPKITTCEKVFKKQYFLITAVAADYASDKNDSSSVEYAVKITRPDESIYFSKEHLSVVNRRIANKNDLQMSDVILKTCFEDNDLKGKYGIEVQIFDHISGKTKTVNSEITLIDLPLFEQDSLKEDDEFNKWFDNYYQNPNPETAIANYIYYSKSKLSDKATSFWPVFSFFLEIAKNNQFLLPQIMNCYKSQDLKRKIYLLYLLRYSNLGTSEFFDNLEGGEKIAYEKIKDTPLIDIYGPVSNASQLDMLWGTFRASGSYQPILKLIQTLEYKKFDGELEKFKNSNKTDEDRKKAMNNVIYSSLVWSLKSNCKQHKLIKEYCGWALQHENLTNVQKEELKAMVN